MRIALTIVLLAALAGCKPPVPGLSSGLTNTAVANVTLVETGVFQVPGQPNARNWCIAGLYARTVLGQPRSQSLTRIAEIGPGGASVGGTAITGSGVLYSIRKQTIFDMLASFLNETRTVGAAVEECI